jgi:hypothetical protein
VRWETESASPAGAEKQTVSRFLTTAPIIFVLIIFRESLHQIFTGFFEVVWQQLHKKRRKKVLLPVTWVLLSVSLK